MKKLLLIIITNTLLQAEKGIPEEALGPIYTEAVWFVGVITLMGIVSFVVSSRNAKRYEEEMSKKRAQLKKREDQERKENLLSRKSKVEDRITALSELRDKGLLKESELAVLKQHLLKMSSV